MALRKKDMEVLETFITKDGTYKLIKRNHKWSYAIIKDRRILHSSSNIDGMNHYMNEYKKNIPIPPTKLNT